MQNRLKKIYYRIQFVSFPQGLTPSFVTAAVNAHYKCIHRGVKITYYIRFYLRQKKKKILKTHIILLLYLPMMLLSFDSIFTI